MKNLFPNLSIHLSQRKGACALDPSLFLSHYGLLLVQSLGEAVELWIARELWHILDSPEFYLNHPEPIAPQTSFVPLIGTQKETYQRQAQKNRVQVLQHWQSYRARTPPTQLNLCWLGDKPGESYLPDGTDPNLIEHWEILARSLEAHAPQNTPRLENPLTPAFRDTAALAAVLGSAFILTHQTSDSQETIDTSPEICQALEAWGIPCHKIDPLDTIAALERDYLLRLIIDTGCSKLLWAGLNLVVLHLVVPPVVTPYRQDHYPWNTHSLLKGCDSERLTCIVNPWEDARGFWYEISASSA